MKLSVIIVNYNVEYFLEQCLHSVMNALKEVEGEVFIVDNNSVDGSVEMVQKKFPTVQLVENKENTGFSKANNQAIKIAKGEYILLLNPDTVVKEDTFKETINFMDKNPDGGGLGVKMIDGKGKFLPESKRGLPTPSVAFYKIFGLSKLFPKSKRFGKYHLGYLNNDEVHPVEILSGAFMLMRKETLDKIGVLDEEFFMYGEDIDLSYRITKGGYKNYYYPKTSIIHYKGESTKKSSVNYVFVFYNAMIIFAKKHFSEKNANLFSFFINLAIYLRAGLAILARIIKRISLPILDTALMMAGFFIIKELYHRYTGINYDNEIIVEAFTGYIIVWLLSVYFSGGYDKNTKFHNILRGVIVGSIVVLLGYSLLPEDLRFSRAITVIGSAFTLLSYFLTRLILQLVSSDSNRYFGNSKKRFAIIGSEKESNRVAQLLQSTNNKTNYISLVNPRANAEKKEYSVGDISQINEIVEIHNIDEIIFCAKNLSSQQIIETMGAMKKKTLDYKIAPEESLFIIGSNSIQTSSELYMLDINSVSKPKNKRVKRLFDIIVSIFLIASFPLGIIIVKQKIDYIRNLFRVLVNQKTFVGYANTELESSKLPNLAESILNPIGKASSVKISEELSKKLNTIYAKDYRWQSDLKVLFKGFKNLGS